MKKYPLLNKMKCFFKGHEPSKLFMKHYFIKDATKALFITRCLCCEGEIFAVSEQVNAFRKPSTPVTFINEQKILSK